MTPEQIALVEATLTQIEPRLDHVAEDFYTRLFTNAPDIESMFHESPEHRHALFATELRATVLLVRDHGAFVAQTSRLGARHRGYGVRGAHYRIARTHLLDALSSELGADWTPQVAQAWASAYDLLAEAMQVGGSTALPGQAPST